MSFHHLNFCVTCRRLGPLPLLGPMDPLRPPLPLEEKAPLGPPLEEPREACPKPPREAPRVLPVPRPVQHAHADLC